MSIYEGIYNIWHEEGEELVFTAWISEELINMVYSDLRKKAPTETLIIVTKH